MGRKKGPVVRAQPPIPRPKPAKSAPTADETAKPPPPSPAPEKLPTTTGKVCQHCKADFTDPHSAEQDLLQHLSSCELAKMNGVPVDEGSDSSLSPPPSNLSNDAIQVRAPNGQVEPPQERSEHVPALAPDEENEETIAARTVRPYVNKTTKFDYYDQAGYTRAPLPLGDPFASDSEAGDPGIDDQDPKSKSSSPVKKQSNDKKSNSDDSSQPMKRYAFPTFTVASHYEKYLTNPKLMSYEKLYHRTSVVTESMLELQKEWDKVDKELYEYEESQKHEIKLANELAKAIQEGNQKQEDKALVQIAKTYEHELQISRKDFIEFQEVYRAEYPNKLEVLELITKLRDPTFSKAFNKRQKKLNGIGPKKDLFDRPIAEGKATKDELELERRKRGRLTDSITFDDMNQADAYGFTYSANDLNRGRQQLPNVRYKEPNRSEVHESRSKRMRALQVETDNDTDEDEDNPPPGKRARRGTRKAVDTTATSPAKSAPVPKGTRTFKSGKRVGRPPNKTKLNEMLLAPASGEVNGVADQEASGTPAIVPDEDAELVSAVEAQVEAAAPVPLKKKRGRQKKVVNPPLEQLVDPLLEAVPAIGAEGNGDNDLHEIAEPPTAEGRGARVRKRTMLEDDYEAPLVPPPAKKAKRVAKSNKAIKEEMLLEAGSGIDDPVLPSTEIPNPTGKRKRGGTAPAQDKSENNSVGVEEDEDNDADGQKPQKKKVKNSKFQTDQERQAAELERRQNQSKKLREAWASGSMAGVTAKKAATNARRKARRERETARIANGGSPNEAFECNSTKDGFIPSDRDEDFGEAIEAEAPAKRKRTTTSKSASAPPVKRANSRAKKATPVAAPISPEEAQPVQAVKKASARGARAKSTAPAEVIEPPPAKKKAAAKASATAPKAILPAVAPAPAPAAKKAAKAPKAEVPAVPEAAPIPLPPTRAGRKRFPPKNRYGFDGAGDDSDYEYEDTPVFPQEAKAPSAPYRSENYRSEYHLYQAITSPGNELGKRVPKKIHNDLKPLMRSSESEEDY